MAVSVAEITFNKFDTDNSGELSATEFRYLCNSMGYNLTDTEITHGLALIDKNQNGIISKAEFLSWYRSARRADNFRLSEEELAARHNASLAFKFFDKNNNGVLDAGEFPDFYAYLGQYNLTGGLTIDELRDALDANHSGRIEFFEYVKYLESIGALPQHSIS